MAASNAPLSTPVCAPETIFKIMGGIISNDDISERAVRNFDIMEKRLAVAVTDGKTYV